MITFSYLLTSPVVTPVDSSSTSPVRPISDGTQFMISDLALDPVTHDIAMPPHFIYGAECIVQRIRVRFKWFYGEWFLNKNEGVPYFQSVLVKNPDLNLIQYIFRRVLTRTPGVLSVQSFDMIHDRASRHLDASFVAHLVDGGVVTAESEPFVLV